MARVDCTTSAGGAICSNGTELISACRIALLFAWQLARARSIMPPWGISGIAARMWERVPSPIEGNSGTNAVAIRRTVARINFSEGRAIG
jgi:hypothetical protein